MPKLWCKNQLTVFESLFLDSNKEFFFFETCKGWIINVAKVSWGLKRRWICSWNIAEQLCVNCPVIFKKPLIRPRKSLKSEWKIWAKESNNHRMRHQSLLARNVYNRTINYDWPERASIEFCILLWFGYYFWYYYRKQILMSEKVAAFLKE